jgi:hypothetical protein
VEIDVDARGSFRAALRVPGPFVGGVRVTALDGRWAVRDGLVATAVALRPADS